ncbi:hypothetical protein Sgleb_50120 [Streptomyces glebosus]|uniref:Uncharacterized protein n=1 Tax=Streptomyces glebosus TaxID=249580 RepID=A0A640T5R2_9ACTN|nr:hypothetical protein [Streptomyces glebosus]GFE16965.1 hypothetical protein Sgleb_50120 [Streptomyces glebosus]GHG52759.1 hypothetical protein GCM10010513_13060 [Streptomyces glebosus]
MEPVDKNRRVPERYEPGEGCLTTAVRLPVRIVVLVLVVPVRLVWDALAALGRAVHRTALRPLGRGLAWLWHTLVVIPVAWTWRTLVVAPLGWFWRSVLTPVGRGIAWLMRGLGVGLVWLGKALFVWPWVALWRYVVAPVGWGVAVVVAWWVRYLVVVPARWLYVSVLTPVGRGIAWLMRGLGVGLVWLGKALFVWPWVALWRYVVAPVGRGVAVVVAWWVRYLVVVPARWLYASVLTPLGHGIVWLVRGIGTVLATLVRWILVVPLVALWRYVLLPAGRALAAVVTVVVREVGAAFGHCWRVAGIISRAVGRFLGTVLRWVFVEPVRWVYRTVLTPLGHGIRNGIWRPARQALRTARETVRQTRQELRRALFGAPREPQRAAAVPPRREPGAPGTRTLGSSTTALTKD